MSLVAEKLVGCVRGRQAKTPCFSVSCELLALQGVTLECANCFQLMVDRCDNSSVFLLSFFVVHGSGGPVFRCGCRPTGVHTLKCEQIVPKAEFAKNGTTSPF